MALPFETLDHFFRTHAFAIPVTLTGVGGAPIINAIFDTDHDVLSDDYNPVSRPVPRLTCKSTDVAAVTQNQVITISGQAYTVADIQPDGTGITTLTLYKQ